MQIIIEGEPKEIAALVSAVQERREMDECAEKAMREYISQRKAAMDSIRDH